MISKKIQILEFFFSFYFLNFNANEWSMLYHVFFCELVFIQG